MDEKNKGTLPADFESIEAAAEFWDTHDLSDHWDETSEVELDVELERRVVLIPLEAQIAQKLSAIARQQGISVETLVNVWLSERLQEAV